MDEKTIEIGIITTTPTEEGVVSVGHGTGLKGQPGFRKLSEAEVAECVALSLSLRCSLLPLIALVLTRSYRARSYLQL